MTLTAGGLRPPCHRKEEVRFKVNVMAKPVRVEVINDGRRYVKIKFLEDCTPFAQVGDIRRVSKSQLVEDKK